MNRNILGIILIAAGVIIVALGANHFFGVRDVTPIANIVEPAGEGSSTGSTESTPGQTTTIGEYGEQY